MWHNQALRRSTWRFDCRDTMKWRDVFPFAKSTTTAYMRGRHEATAAPHSCSICCQGRTSGRYGSECIGTVCAMITSRTIRGALSRRVSGNSSGRRRAAAHMPQLIGWLEATMTGIGRQGPAKRLEFTSEGSQKTPGSLLPQSQAIYSEKERRG